MVRRGVLQVWDVGTYTCTVQMAASLGQYLAGIKVSRAIAGAEMVVGRSVAVAVFDEGNPTDAVVVAVY
ncbi:MAG: hypothetical protein EPO21_11805 [Chloroflexota bacterium]|nr:MAG: hypothetical protein EPO21_11805 [Chloroflexota bacterium]